MVTRMGRTRSRAADTREHGEQKRMHRARTHANTNKRTSARTRTPSHAVTHAPHLVGRCGRAPVQPARARPPPRRLGSASRRCCCPHCRRWWRPGCSARLPRDRRRRCRGRPWPHPPALCKDPGRRRCARPLGRRRRQAGTIRAPARRRRGRRRRGGAARDRAGWAAGVRACRAGMGNRWRGRGDSRRVGSMRRSEAPPHTPRPK